MWRAPRRGTGEVRCGSSMVEFSGFPASQPARSGRIRKSLSSFPPLARKIFIFFRIDVPWRQASQRGHASDARRRGEEFELATRHGRLQGLWRRRLAGPDRDAGRGGIDPGRRSHGHRDGAAAGRAAAPGSVRPRACSKVGSGRKSGKAAWLRLRRPQ